MIIVRAESQYGEEFFAMGETVSGAIDALEQVSELPLEFQGMTFFDAKQIKVAKRSKYKILD
jgi:hypothetical protein